MQEKLERLQKIQSQIREACQQSGRPESAVRLLGVSKTKSWEDVRDFAQLGLKDFGENYVQEALAKSDQFSEWQKSAAPELRIDWHFIGGLQSNKAKFIPGNFTLFHALDSLSVAQKLDRSAHGKGIIQGCLIEVNIDHEESKGGLQPEVLPKFLESLNQLPNLEIQGLMCLPAPREGTDARKPFSVLREIMGKLNASGAYRLPLKELSMGMSGDFEAAILEGSTIVRVGTSLFGRR